MDKMTIFLLSFVVKVEFPKSNVWIGKSQYYLTIYDQFYENCYGVSNVYYFIRDNLEKNELQIQHHCSS